MTPERFTVYAHAETDLEEKLAPRNVATTCELLPPDRPEPIVTIREDGQTVGALSVAELERFLSPSVDTSERSTPGSLDSTFELFDETPFTALNRQQLFLASREIEVRARRVGTGELHVHFQSQRSFEQQTQLYRQLAQTTDLSIHLYRTVDRIDGVTAHSDPDGQLAQFWCLAFDGGDNPEQACVLVAAGRDSGYRGFWSYDPELVAAVIDCFETLE